MPLPDLRPPRRTPEQWDALALITPEDIEAAALAGRTRVRDAYKTLADATLYTPPE